MSFRVLLLELPFKAVVRPSLGLEILHSALGAAGIESEVWYANLEFAARIGEEKYTALAESVPQELLLGDRIFAPEDRSGFVTPSPAERLRIIEDDGTFLGSIPEWLLTNFPEFRTAGALFLDGLAERIVARNFNLVGLSAMFQVMPSLGLARRLKRRAPGLRTVLGGPQCEGEMGVALHERFPEIDFVCRGDGERLLVNLVKALEVGAEEQLPKLHGLVFRGAGRSISVGNAGEKILNLDEIPKPRFSTWLQEVSDRLPALSRDRLWIPIETSRGCWYGQKNHCTFCGLNGESLAFRAKTVTAAIEDVKHAASYGIKNIYAVDLIMDMRFFETFLPQVEALNLDLNIFYEIKSNLEDRHIAALARAGVRQVQPGIESLSTHVLGLMRKGVTALQNVRLLRLAAEYGVAVHWNLIYGFPDERAEDYLEMARLLPILSHLMPPALGCYRVRVDRFSPLQFDAKRLGLGTIRPAEAYAMVYGDDPEFLGRVCYHFEQESDVSRPAGLGELNASIRRWRESVGSDSLVSLRRDDSTRVLDRRIGRMVEYTLDGALETVYLKCSRGATRRQLREST